MGLGEKKITCHRARGLDIVDFLAGQGTRPVKTRGNDYWYYSPLREEQTASFKVNRKINRWFDFGEGVGGNLVDLGVRLHRCTVGSFLEILEGTALPESLRKSQMQIPDPPGITVEEITIISAPYLVTYLQSRCIPLSVAQQYLHEVQFKWNNKEYHALGFLNNRYKNVARRFHC